jgi:hypothetical protein
MSNLFNHISREAANPSTTETDFLIDPSQSSIDYHDHHAHQNNQYLNTNSHTNISEQQQQQPFQLFHFHNDHDIDPVHSNQSVIMIVDEDCSSTIKNVTHNQSHVSNNHMLANSNNSYQELSANSSQTSLNSREQINTPKTQLNNFAFYPNSNNNATNSMNTIVPAISNGEEVFQLLSHKIAKYCQILSDLTNCEVFYKAQLPLNSSNNNNNAGNKTSYSKYKPKKIVNKNIKSLYWGTHKMLFEFSHGNGIKYERINGDSLIKIGNRSLSSDINSLIEELLNEPNKSSVLKHPVRSGNSPNTPESDKNNLFNKRVKEASSNGTQLKECFIHLDRLDDSIFEQYLNKFEMENINLDNTHTIFNLDELIVDEYKKEDEIFSDESRLKHDKNICTNNNLKNNNNNKRMKLSEEVEEDDDNEEEGNESDGDFDDERALLERNCFNLNDTDLNENEDDYFSCEHCSGHSYKHLTQLKVSFLLVIFFQKYLIRFLQISKIYH